LDAAGVGTIDQVCDWNNRPVLAIKATGHGSYRYTPVFNNGFQTGDWMRAEVPKGNKAGVHVGRMAIQRTGSFNLQPPGGTVAGISHRYCRVLQRADGYSYCVQPKPLTEETRRAA
jgi:hypothetical protein